MASAAWIPTLLLIAAAAAPPPQPHPAAGAPPGAAVAPDRPRVVRILESDPARVSRLIGRLDVWEVRRDLGYLVALVEPRDHEALLREGLRVEVDAARTQRFLSPPGFPCYDVVDDLHARMAALAAAHPDLAELTSIGASWSGEPLRLLRLTNRARPGPKPTFFAVAAVHAREMTTPEVALHLAERLLGGYGSDPDATWLLDHHEAHVVAVANPDGRRLADLGLYQRKNINDSNGGACADPPTPANQLGTDLNRNHSWHWNCCAGSSADPCAQTYHGAGPASEPETVALQGHLVSIFPDQRGDHRNAEAPLDATGILVTLHSYGRLVLWPWGDVFPAPPNGADLELLGTKLADFMGYTPMQASDLYITDGATDDWLYGQRGVASFTFEMGDDFFEDCAAVPAIEQSVLGALMYAARVARAPYRLVRGPDVTAAAATPEGGEAPFPATLSADASELLHGGQPVASISYFLDVPPWEGGSAVPMLPADGAFGSAQESAVASVDTAALAPGRHVVFVQATDASGNAGAVKGALLVVYPQSGVPVQGLDVLPAAAGGVTLAWEPLAGAQSYRVAAGTLGGLYDHAYVACGVGGTSVAIPDPGTSAYLLVEAVLPGPYAGGFGPDSAGLRRPAAGGACP